MSGRIVTRFAPSPTGFLHVGGLRTALYAYALAKKSGGAFILRIEDTDQARTVAGGVENLLDALDWAGIVPDEGVCLDEQGALSEKGAHGPYTQSKRLAIYRKHADELVEKGFAYPCFCTPERLEQVREEKQANKLPPGYDGFCKALSDEERSEKLASGAPHVIRLAMPDDGETAFDDAIRGTVAFKNEDVDDQVLLKSDGFPTYHLAVVVDDHLMDVTHVIRGEEWISSTPKHLHLYRCFGWHAPVFAHLPLLLNTDKSKLSKRQGDVAVTDYREKGYLPQALLNFVAFLGWNPGDEREFFSLDQFVSEFSLEKVGKAGAVFNLEKLDWYNREYIKKLDRGAVLEQIKKFLPDAVTALSGYSEEILSRMVPVIAERISKFSDIAAMADAGELAYFFERPEYGAETLVWKTSTEDACLRHLREAREIVAALPEREPSAEAAKDALWPYAEAEGRGDVLWPVRMALSGRDKSPDPFTLIAILGRDESVARLDAAILKLS